MLRLTSRCFAPLELNAQISPESKVIMQSQITIASLYVHLIVFAFVKQRSIRSQSAPSADRFECSDRENGGAQ